MKSYVNILLLIALVVFTEEENLEKDYEKLLKWGLDNSLKISDKIKIKIDTKNNTIRYVAKNLIPEDELIMDIPPKIMLTLNSTLNLLNSKRFNDAYKKYVKYDSEANGEESYNINLHLEQSFLSYILYLIKHKPKTYKKNAFYKFYKPLLKTLKDKNMESSPFFFSNEQMKIFLNTSFGSIFEIINKYLLDEVNVFENIIFNRSIDFDEYLPFRLLSVNKGFNISNHNNIVPFLYFFDNSYTVHNCNYTIENNHVKVYSTKNIFPGDALVIKPDYMVNINRLIFFGTTFEEMVDVIPNFNIPAMVPFFLEGEGIKIADTNIEERVDLVDPKFYESVLPLYKNLCKKLNREVSDANAYKLFLKNLEVIRKNYDYVTSSDINALFYKQSEVTNAKRIFKGEKNILDKKIKVLKDVIHKIEHKNKEEIEKPDEL